MPELLHALGHAAAEMILMTWHIFWALVLGFALSGAVQAVVSKSEVGRLMPDDRPRSVLTAAALGAASSSCSYAAVALARSLFRKGADLTSAIVFEVASTNLVAELGILLAVLIGWQFTLAEFVGGATMIVVVVAGMRRIATKPLVEQARQQADRGLRGRMEQHAEMDMSVQEGPLLRRLLSPDGFTATSHSFVMDWASVWSDILLGVVVAGALGAWVPAGFWKAMFLVDHPVLAKIWGPLIGPVVGVASFVCSVGNVPLAAVLWTGGISFGGAVSFLYADLIVVPVILIYRKYYGGSMTIRLVGLLYGSSVVAGYLVEVLFGVLGLVPGRHASFGTGHVRLNYTMVLDVVFGALAAVLVLRFVLTGGVPMLKGMDGDEA